MDNYYTSYALFADLYNKNIRATGTARIDRLNLDLEEKKNILKLKI
jgi:hypothetical protein